MKVILEPTTSVIVEKLVSSDSILSGSDNEMITGSEVVGNSEEPSSCGTVELVGGYDVDYEGSEPPLKVRQTFLVICCCHGDHFTVEREREMHSHLTIIPISLSLHLPWAWTLKMTASS